MLINAVPQFQGALSERAPELPQGCVALAELAGHVLGVPVHHILQTRETSPVVDGVANRAVLIGENRAAQLAALEAPGGPVLTIGGDCGVELVPIGVARYRYGSGLGVAWFDAHPDLNTAETSPSGAFHGMVLRSLLGEGDPDFAADPPIEPGRVVLAGTRVFDEAERAAVDRGLVVEAHDVAAGLAGADKVYVHLDLDVLDPGEFDGLNYPEPGGLTIERLVTMLRGLSGFDVIGAGITECAGTDVRVLEPVLAVLGELLTGTR
ncbi:arginase family protein [Amycolatopsis pittospori]|uniref:arginase family protein n=1 Tax=Amycolatopsis pittospori TaxID=2749434 RepID=UPI0015F0C2BE|nr:arginase family protein [Amycolatopsis pittospori]